MLSPLHVKRGAITLPAAAVNNAAVGTTVIDTLGSDYIMIDIQIGVTDSNLSNFQVYESDLANMSGGTAVPKTVFGTDLNDAGTTSILPLAASDDNKAYGIFIDLRARKRYLDVQLTSAAGSAGAFITGNYYLFRNEHTPATAVEAGWAQRMIA